MEHDRIAESARAAFRETEEYKAARAAKLDATTRLVAARFRESSAARKTAVVLAPNLSKKRPSKV